MSNGAKLYLKDVAALLECPAAKKKEVLAFVEDSIAEHGLEDADYNAIADTVGEPQQIARIYAEHITAADRLAVRRHRKLFTILVGTVVAIVAALSIFIATLAIQEHFDLKAYRNGYYVETISVGEAIPVENNTK